MCNVKIIADSTCDLSRELFLKYNISVLPLMITMGEQSFQDLAEITPDQIYRWSDASGKTPKTSSPQMGMVMELLSSYENTGIDLIFIGISEAMSVTCQEVRTAAEEISGVKVHVIDSKNLSTGIGLCVLKAAELASEGKDAETIVQTVLSMRNKVRSSFVVDSVTYLYRGGRCNAATALISNTIRLKPEIVVSDGAMKVNKKYRGRQEKVVMNYVMDKKEELLRADCSRVFITHSGISQTIIDEVYSFISGLGYFKEILVTRAGGVISSHCGPETLGVLYCEK